MSKEPKVTKMWRILEDAGVVSDANDKEINITCEEVRASSLAEKPMFNAMVIFSHLLSCEGCRKRSLEKEENH